MRILYIDVDSLRPDHLGCYGYHRATSPHIDRIAEQAVRFDNCYVSDSPCLPSRTALWSGQTGYHTGVINHGGQAAQPYPQPDRGFRDRFHTEGWMTALRRAGYHTATVSPFGERHAAWHWYAGFNDILNTGRSGMERADEIAPPALDWLDQHGAGDNWFLHVNFWDPHTPYRTPLDFGNPFADDPLPAWITPELRQHAWDQHVGMRAAQEPHGWGYEDYWRNYPRLPESLDSMDTLRQWLDGYDVGIRYMDHHVGLLLDKLAALGVLDETAIIVSADHGENQGELGVWGDHQTADHYTNRVPLLVRWPGLTNTPRQEAGLIYQFDWAATLIELTGGTVPAAWDGAPFTAALQAGQPVAGRPALIFGQGALTCQRAIRWENWLCIRTYHDGYKLYPELMLFDLAADPHEQHDLAQARPDIVAQAMRYYADWEVAMQRASRTNIDPMTSVLRDGGPYHAVGELPRYLARLRATGRGAQADALTAKYPADAAGA